MQVLIVQFLSIIFFSWISSIFVGFFKSSRFFVSSCTTWPVPATSFTVLRDRRSLLRVYLQLTTAHSLDNAIRIVARSKVTDVATVMMQEWQRPRSGGAGRFWPLSRGKNMNPVLSNHLCIAYDERLSVTGWTSAGDMNAIRTAWA